MRAGNVCVRYACAERFVRGRRVGLETGTGDRAVRVWSKCVREVCVRDGEC